MGRTQHLQAKGRDLRGCSLWGLKWLDCIAHPGSSLALPLSGQGHLHDQEWFYRKTRHLVEGDESILFFLLLLEGELLRKAACGTPMGHSV